MTPMANERVLLVDDEKEFTDTLSERMTIRDIEVDTASSGAEALEKAKKTTYDAIVLDLSMPGMDGMETLKRLLEDNPDLQIILLTGHASLEKSVEAVKMGAMDFLEKPAEIQQLLEKIDQAKTNKMILVEEKAAMKIKDIMRDKWS